uniref:MYND-type domain-containing protein n=1 Tax=Parascaris univalens TaxID=6257 RepID=A0A915A688_PARUN
MWRNGLLVERPMCWTVAPKYLPNYCSYCLEPDRTTKLEKCAACKSIFYCSRSCQKADWPMHKVECKFSKISDDLVQSIICKIFINSFGLTSVFGKNIGIALCLQLSALDHSCKPTAR